MMASEFTATTTESESESEMPEQLRSGLSFLPLIIGLTRPLSGSGPDLVVLVNPVTQRMIVLDGDAAMITEMLGGAGAAGVPPASKASIESMRSVDSLELQGSEECSVCLDALKEEEVVVKEMPCRHRFHGGCIEKWLKMHGSCPVCRFQMPMEEGAALKKEGDEQGEGNGERRRGREIWVTVTVTRNNDNDSASDEQEEGEEHAGDDQSQI